MKTAKSVRGIGLKCVYTVLQGRNMGMFWVFEHPEISAKI